MHDLLFSAFWRVQKQLRNLEGQGGEFPSGSLAAVFFGTQSDPLESKFANVHFLFRQRPLSLRGQVFPLPPRKRSTRYSDALRSAGEKLRERDWHVARGFTSW